MRGNKFEKSHISPDSILDNLFVKSKYFNQYVLQEGGELTWRVSDCEELVGVTYKRYGIVVSYTAC